MDSSTIDSATVLDERKAGEVEYQSLIERLRWVESDDDGVFKEAAQVLREVRDLLLSKGVDRLGVTPSVLGYDLLKNLSVQHTHQVAVKEFIQQDLIQMLEGEVSQENGLRMERGNLTASGFLEEATIVLDSLRPDPRAEDLLRRITDRTRVSRSQSSEQVHQVHCDGTRYGHPCWEKGPQAPTQEWAEDYARRALWLVTPEKDLCPDCWQEADPEAWAQASPPEHIMTDARFLGPEMSFEPRAGLLPPSPEDERLVVMQTLGGAILSCGSPQKAADLLLSMFDQATLASSLSLCADLETMIELLKTQQPAFRVSEDDIRRLIVLLTAATDPIPTPGA